MKNPCKPQCSKGVYVSTCFINYISQYGQELALYKIHGSTWRGTTVKSSGKFSVIFWLKNYYLYALIWNKIDLSAVIKAI